MESKRMVLNSPITLPSEKIVRLSYTIHSWSGHLSKFHPKHIMTDAPHDKFSRWSTDSSSAPQFLVVELDNVAVVQSITFGKYHKPHICNMKMFKVFGGMSLNDMTEILDEGLANDSQPETFTIKYNTKGVLFPCKYLKIVPLASWGSKYNFSIWYLQVMGVDQPEYVEGVLKSFNKYLEKKAIRLCLKYFRQRGYDDVFNALETATNIELEHHMLTKIYDVLVLEGDFEHCEKLILEAYNQGLFDEYCELHNYQPIWRRIYSFDKEGASPIARGGHQLCYNTNDHSLYLLGGWDGAQDLADFWRYDVLHQSWHLISSNTENEGGPGARSCCKMVLDPNSNRIYVLGKYMSSAQASEVSPHSDFFMYDIAMQRWTKLFDDTKLVGGPSLIFDHQMCFDEINQIIYVSGGRKVQLLDPDGKPPKAKYSKLYAYHVNLNKWLRLRPKLPINIHHGTIIDDELIGRNSHSMVFDALNQCLIILGGDRNGQFLNDMYLYHIPSNSITIPTRDFTSMNGPLPGFAQSVTYSSTKGELYFFSGMSRENEVNAKTILANTVWVYHFKQERWELAYKNENTDDDYWRDAQRREPRPRFAHQMCFIESLGCHYLFGGNPNFEVKEKQRLDDLWELRLIKPEPSQILRHARLLLRKQRFVEMCQQSENQLSALNYLRTMIGPLIDPNSSSEKAAFHRLATQLFVTSVSDIDNFTAPGLGLVPELEVGLGLGQMSLMLGEGNGKLGARKQLYERLAEVFPVDMKMPKENLLEMVRHM